MAEYKLFIEHNNIHFGKEWNSIRIEELHYLKMKFKQKIGKEKIQECAIYWNNQLSTENTRYNIKTHYLYVKILLFLLSLPVVCCCCCCFWFAATFAKYNLFYAVVQFQYIKLLFYRFSFIVHWADSHAHFFYI